MANARLPDGNSNVWSISHHFEICTKIIKFQKFDLENERQGQRVERDLRHSIGNVRFHIGEFFSEFYLPVNIHYEKGHTHTLIHTDTAQYTG